MFLKNSVSIHNILDRKPYNIISDPKTRKIVQRKYKSPMVSFIFCTIYDVTQSSRSYEKHVIGRENCSQPSPGHFGAFRTKNVPFRTQGWIAHNIIENIKTSRFKYSIWYYFDIFLYFCTNVSFYAF